MEWPGQDPADALTSTLNAITDFYRIKLAGGTKGARATIATIGNAITAAKNGKAIRSKAANVLKGRTEAYPEFTCNPVTDWQIARARPTDTSAYRHPRVTFRSNAANSAL
jgi:DNA helicase-2/ATP-dependent DNA helicase PcrA